MLHHEEILWKQKARCDWLNFNNRNTKFFHTHALQRRKNNCIIAICNSSRNWIFDPKAIEVEAKNFFQNLYGEDLGLTRDLLAHNFPSLDSSNLDFLGRVVTNEEIKFALFDMAPLKTLGSNGFHAFLFQKLWDTVGPTVCD